MNQIVDSETQRALIDATHLLSDFVSKKLPRGWEIVMTMRRGACEIELFDPSADLLETEAPGDGISLIDSLCTEALQQEREKSR